MIGDRIDKIQDEGLYIRIIGRKAGKRIMKLSDLLLYDDILIQCHDNPDGDALASGYGVYFYLKKMGKSPRLCYAGRFSVRKSNLQLMVKELNIPVVHLSEEEVAVINNEKRPELLITVDCQYGEGNVTRIMAQHVAMIDHHQLGNSECTELTRILPGLGSCATLVYQMLMEEGIPINEDENLSTALYYGLLTDTNNFAELCHPMDRNLQDDANYRKSLIRMFRNANISLEEIEIAGDALLHYYFDEEDCYAIVEAKPCDPNILGMISDMILEVDVVKSCLVYSIQEFGTKLSVRSCVREVQASELAAYLTEGVGNGGGHLDKAGGFISKTGEEAVLLLSERMKSYFRNTEIIDVADYKADVAGWKKYCKLPLEVGYVRGVDIAEEKQEVVVRTLEGDQLIHIEKDTYIMIGITGEIYPISEEKFLTNYECIEKSYATDFAYEPELIDSRTGTRINLVKKAKCCVSIGKACIFAKCLEHRVKVFTSWDRDRYYLGKEGDYMAVREDDRSDVYIINGEIFRMTYCEV